MPLLPKTKTVAFVALLALATAACVKQDAPGVGVVKFESSAVFGITPNKPVVPDFNVPEDLSSIVPDLPLTTTVLPKPPEGPCPAAKLTAFPKKSASVDVVGTPPEGLYRWKRPLFTTKNTAFSPPEKSLPFTLQSRGIRRVTKGTTDHDFDFEMVAPDDFVPGDTIITAFHVNTNKALIADRRVDSRSIGVVNIPGTDVRISYPNDEAGIFISSIEVQDAKGTQVSLFKPVQPMLVLPLEGGILRTGQSFRSVGIDASSGQAIVNDGITGRASRIDACGEIVEGYSVSLKQILTRDLDMNDPVGAAATIANRQQTREVGYTFATEYGALPIGETLSIGDVNSDPVAALAKWELGGLTPTALPDNLK